VVTGIGLGLETFAMITLDVVTNEADTLAHHDRVRYGQVRPHRDGRLAVIAAKFDVALKSIAR